MKEYMREWQRHEALRGWGDFRGRADWNGGSQVENQAIQMKCSRQAKFRDDLMRHKAEEKMNDQERFSRQMNQTLEILADAIQKLDVPLAQKESCRGWCGTCANSRIRRAGQKAYPVAYAGRRGAQPTLSDTRRSSAIRSN